MLLAIDIGNTNTVFAACRGEELLQSWRSETVALKNADEYAVFLKELFELEGVGFADIEDVIISSVVPDANSHIRKFCGKYLHRDPVFVTHENAGIPIALEQPGEAGADRIVNAVAVLAHYQAPAIVIDFGTATTFDVISADGAYTGGAIAPGINLSIAALHQAAAKLPKVSIKKPGRVIGKNTTEAIQAGIYWGYLGLIEGIVGQITDELGVKPFVLATGGLASLFAGNTAVIDAVDEDLTLKGLLSVYQGLERQVEGENEQVRKTA